MMGRQTPVAHANAQVHGRHVVHLQLGHGGVFVALVVRRGVHRHLEVVALLHHVVRDARHYRRALRHHLRRVHAGPHALLPEDAHDVVADARDVGTAAHQDHVGDVLLLLQRLLQTLLDALHTGCEQRVVRVLQHLSRHREVELVAHKLLQIDVVALHAAQRDLRLLHRVVQLDVVHQALRDVLARHLRESGHHLLHQVVRHVIAAEVRVAAAAHHRVCLLVDTDHGNVQRAAAKVEHQHHLVRNGVDQAVGNGRRSRIAHQVHRVDASNLRRVNRVIALHIVVVRGDRDGDLAYLGRAGTRTRSSRPGKSDRP